MELLKDTSLAEAAPAPQSAEEPPKIVSINIEQDSTDVLEPPDPLEESALSLALECEDDAERAELIALLLSDPNIDPNAPDAGSGLPPLAKAVERDDLISCRLFMNHPLIDVDLVDSEGHSPFTRALERFVDDPDVNRLEIAFLLIAQAKIPPDFSDADGVPHLIKAVQSESITTCRLLLHSPTINVNVTNEDGATPLSIALDQIAVNDVADDDGDSDRQSMAMLLASHPNIDPNHVDRDGHSLLTRAIRRGNTNACQCLMLAWPALRINDPDVKGNTPLMTAYQSARQDSSSSDLDIIQLLLSQPDIEINHQNKDGATALIIAGRRGFRRAVNDLLARPDLDLVQSLPRSTDALRLAVRQEEPNGTWPESISMRTLLVKLDVDVNETTRHEKDPLLLLALDCQDITERHEKLRLLLSHPDIDPNALSRNIQRTSALSKAIKACDLESTRLLLAHPSIDVNISGVPALLLALDCSSKNEDRNKIISLLISQPSIDCNRSSNSGLTALGRAIKLGDLYTCDLLVSHPSIDVNMSISSEVGKTTPLILALNQISRGAHGLEICRLLLSHPHIDVNKRDDEGWSPLARVVKTGNLNACRLVISHPSVDVNTLVVESTRFETAVSPLMLALKDIGKGSGREEIVQLLLSHPNIDPNAPKNAPLHDALKDNNYNACHLLLAHPEIQVDLDSIEALFKQGLCRKRTFDLVKNYPKLQGGMGDAAGDSDIEMGSPEDELPEPFASSSAPESRIPDAPPIRYPDVTL